jgi:hypothetical protein
MGFLVYCPRCHRHTSDAPRAIHESDAVAEWQVDICKKYKEKSMNRLAIIANRIAAGEMSLVELQNQIDSIARVAPPINMPEHTDAIASAMKVCMDFVKSNKGGRKPVATKWGFDKADFHNAINFSHVLSAVGISATQEASRGSMGEFSWKRSGVEIVTGNNPITGEYMQGERRDPEVGYAGYIGVEGNPDMVAIAVKAIKRYADYEDESPNARDFI